MSDNTYNGWKNYETWNVKLWIDNDEGSYNYWRDRADEICKGARADRIFTRKERAVIELADALKDEREENAPETVGVYADLLNAALSEVDWREIAEAMIEDSEFDFSEDDETEDELEEVEG